MLAAEARQHLPAYTWAKIQIAFQNDGARRRKIPGKFFGCLLLLILYSSILQSRYCHALHCAHLLSRIFKLNRIFKLDIGDS